jgi:hypothetical protein
LSTTNFIGHGLSTVSAVSSSIVAKSPTIAGERRLA